MNLQEQESFECVDCKDEGGKIARNEDGYEVWRPCSCIERKRIKRLMAFSNISDEFKKKTFSNFQHEGVHEHVSQALKTARGYVVKYSEVQSTRENSIALLGAVGSGKTHLLMAVSNNLLAKGIEVKYFPWVEGFNSIKNDFSLLEEKVNMLKNAEVLFIDDMFKGRREPTDFELQQLFGIINYRYMERKPLLISSEKSIAQMCKFDEAIGSRINEMCRDFKVHLTGGKELNYRLKTM